MPSTLLALSLTVELAAGQGNLCSVSSPSSSVGQELQGKVLLPVAVGQDIARVLGCVTGQPECHFLVVGFTFLLVQS